MQLAFNIILSAKHITDALIRARWEVTTVYYSVMRYTLKIHEDECEFCAINELIFCLSIEFAEGNKTTLWLIIVLASVAGGALIIFGFSMLCYRYSNEN